MHRDTRKHTSLLLLNSHLMPVNLHTVPELHPQISLLLGGHALPALLNPGERRVRDGMLGGGASLLLLLGSDHGLLLGVQASHWACGRAGGRRGNGCAASNSPGGGPKEHCVRKGGRCVGVEKRERKFNQNTKKGQLTEMVECQG